MFTAALKEWRRSGKSVLLTGTNAVPSQHPSMLAPRLFAELDTSQRLTVLDLGSASGDTVELFSEYKCRLNFIDLLGELGEEDFNPDSDTEGLRSKLQELLGGENDPPIDVCLFWDALNYLHPQTLALFNECLAPRLRPSSLGHAYSVRSSDVALEWASYGFESTDTVSSAPKAGKPPLCFPHPPSVMNDTLTSFRVERGVLLRDGRLEVLLRPTISEDDDLAVA